MRPLAAPAWVLVLVIASCSSGGKKAAGPRVTSTSPPTTRPSARCRTPELQATGVDPGGAATGHSIGYVHLKNVSGRTCDLFGYPGVTLADASGNPIPTKDQRGSGFITNGDPPKVVTLRPAASAVFGLETHACDATGDHLGPTSASLQIIPPDETDHLTLPAQEALCQDQTLIVSAVRATQAEIAQHG